MASTKQRGVGRPIVPLPCPYCKKVMGTVAYREHTPHCPKRPK